MKRFSTVITAALLVSALAHGSGFYFGDNGAKAMVQGGAFTAQADDLTAMQHNPAGLAQQQGFSFLADFRFLRHQVTYSRQDPGFDPANPSALINTVSSQTDPYVLPYFGLSYGFPIANRPFTVGLGLFAPPSQGHYVYPNPNYAKDEMGKYVENPRKFAPQRYAMISNDIIIAYPTLSLAYEIIPMLSVGVSAQLTVSNFKQTQTLFGGDALGFDPMTQLQENPDYDATVSIDLPGQVGFTGIIGLLFKPTSWLSFGASVRPPIPFKAHGKITVELSDFFKNAGATVSGDTATLTMTLPLEVRFGARATPFKGLGINFDFVYQGWNSVDQLLLSPDNLTITNMGNSSAIAPFAVKKNWMPTFSARLGASYRIFQYLSASLGVLFETGASPTSTYSVDWTHPTRFIFTGGLTGHLGPIEVIAGAMFTPTNTTVVTDSIVQRGQSNAMSAPAYVGNGIYTSGGFGIITGIRGNFGGSKPAATPVETKPEEPKPAATEPAPATDVKPADAAP
ncbi:MAG: outer membrane protein transport protein [Myxococcaceae bacterium]